MRQITPRYSEGDRVMLATFEEQPREPATVLTVDVYPDWSTVDTECVSYVVKVDAPEDEDDDCLRELTEDQIEGPLVQ